MDEDADDWFHSLNVLFFQRLMHGMVLVLKRQDWMLEHFQGATMARANSRVTSWPPRYPRDKLKTRKPSISCFITYQCLESCLANILDMLGRAPFSACSGLASKCYYTRFMNMSKNKGYRMIVVRISQHIHVIRWHSRDFFSIHLNTMAAMTVLAS